MSTMSSIGTAKSSKIGLNLQQYSKHTRLRIIKQRNTDIAKGSQIQFITNEFQSDILCLSSTNHRLYTCTASSSSSPFFQVSAIIFHKLFSCRKNPTQRFAAAPRVGFADCDLKRYRQTGLFWMSSSRRPR
jgi:hypothetical protein